MSPDCLPPARCDFSHARKGKQPFQEKTLEKGRFPFLAWEKSHLAGGRHTWGSLISVPLALRVFFFLGGGEYIFFFSGPKVSSGQVRPRQGTEICSFGAPSPLEALHWIFCFLSSIDVQFSKTSPLKSGESSEKSSGENRVKSCHVCGCHGFFGPEKRPPSH